MSPASQPIPAPLKSCKSPSKLSMSLALSMTQPRLSHALETPSLLPVTFYTYVHRGSALFQVDCWTHEDSTVEHRRAPPLRSGLPLLRQYTRCALGPVHVVHVPSTVCSTPCSVGLRVARVLRHGAALRPCSRSDSECLCLWIDNGQSDWLGSERFSTDCEIISIIVGGPRGGGLAQGN